MSLSCRASLAPTFALVLAAGLLAARPAHGQARRDTMMLDEIVVTATRLPMPRAAAASAVTVVSGDELRARGITTLLEAVRSVPGATLVQAGSFGAPASLFLRGGESDFVRVLVDGVPLNAPGGAFDFAHLSTDNVDRIEVVRGPASVLYGSDAVAGVVQVFTRAGRGAPRWRVSASSGTWAFSRLAAEAAAGSDRAGFSVSASRAESDGTYPFNSDYWKREVSALLRATTPDARSEARLTVRLDDHRTHFPTDGGGRVVDRNQFTIGGQSALGLALRRILGPRLETRVLLGASAVDLDFDDRPDGLSDTLGVYAFASRSRETRRSADARLIAYPAPGTTVTVGGTLEREADRSRDSSDSEWGSSGGSFAAARRNAALYAHVVADAGGRLAVTAGVRVDRNQRFGSFATSRAGVSWRLGPGARVRAAVGTALKEPTFFENFATGYVTGNPDLRPERSRGGEVGADVEIGRGSLAATVTAFTQRFADLIQYTGAAPAGGPNYFNVAAARAAGVEAEIAVRLGAGLTAHGRYTYLSTSVLDAGFETGPDAAYVAGRRLLRRPTHAAGAALSYARAATSVTVAADRLGDRDDIDYARDDAWPRVRLPARTRVDASATLALLGRPAAAGLVATIRVENLVNARYEDVRGFPAPRRTILIGLRAEGGLR